MTTSCIIKNMHIKKKKKETRGRLLYIIQNLVPQMLTDTPVPNPSAKAPDKRVLLTGTKASRGLLKQRCEALPYCMDLSNCQLSSYTNLKTKEKLLHINKRTEFGLFNMTFSSPWCAGPPNSPTFIS